MGGAESFFSLEVADASDLAGVLPDRIGAIHRRELGGILIRGLIPPARALAAAERLEAGHDFAAHQLGVQFEAWSLGLVLDHASPELEDYLGGVPAWEAACRAAELDDLVDQVSGALAALAGGRPVEAPRGPDGRPYLANSIRRLPEGGILPPHCGLEQMTRPPYGHLNTLLDGVTMISFFTPLAPALQGGELIVHDLIFGELDASCMHRGRIRVEHLLDSAERRVIAPGAGDLLVFDGGRYIHQVAPVRGGRTRWTLGGFMAMDPEGLRVYRWS